MAISEKRTQKYQKIQALEALLSELNGNLKSANQAYREETSERHVKLFIVGAHRTGSTLFMQWLASLGIVAYPTNLLSRFYGAPLVGAKIQQLLTDPRYNFRDEILDFNSKLVFLSNNGKTKGALAPNEFWYFWRRFFPFKELDYMSNDEMKELADLKGFRDELNALSNIFDKPFVMKGLIMNQSLSTLAEQFERCIFIFIYRNPIFTIQSALEARKEQLGDMSSWYSFKIREYPGLVDLEPLESVTGQIIAINKSVEDGLALIPETQKLVIRYEDFCDSPEHCYNQLVSKLIGNGYSPNEFPKYTGVSNFANNNSWRLTEYKQCDVEKLYEILAG